MDLYQGSLPRKFIPFELGISSNDAETPNPCPQIPVQDKVPAVSSPEFQFCSKRSDYDSDTTSGGDKTENASEMVEKMDADSSSEKITPDASLEHTSKICEPVIGEVIQGSAVPAVPHSVVITTSGPNRDGLELVFPASLAPQDIENYRQSVIAEGIGPGAP